MQLRLFYSFSAGIILAVFAAGMCLAQSAVISTLAGGSGPLDGSGSQALFAGPWQIHVRDTLAFIADKDNDALRTMSLRTKKVNSLLINQKDISGMALSSGGDSIFFCTNSRILKRYVRSTQTLTILDTLPDADIDAIACRRNGALIIGSALGHRLAEWTGPDQIQTLARKLNTSGLVEGLDTVARFNRISSVVLSQTEDTMYISDRFNSKIRRYIRSTKQVSSIATGTLLLGPRQLAFSKRRDTLFVGNSSRHTLIAVPLRVGAAFILCGGNGIDGYADGTAVTSRFSFPMGLARSDSGFVICDNGNKRIRLFKNGLTRSVAGAGFIGDGVGPDCRFNVPFDLAKHPFKDSLYVTDQNNHAIRLVDLTNNRVSTLVGNGISGNVSGNNPAAVRLNRPTNLAMSPSGDTLFFVEPFANKIKYLLTKSNQVRLLAGSDTIGFRDYPIGRFAHFNRPQDIAYRDGYVYISDALNHKIRRIRVSTTAVTTFAGTTAGFKDSTLLGAKFNRPSTLEWVGNELWVGEDAGLKIRKIIPDSDTVIRWAGSGNIGLIDGPGAVARFMGVNKITYDPFRNGFLVAAYLNEGVCRFVPRDTSLVSTFFNATGFQDGPLAQAKFLGPLGYQADLPSQRLFFTDAGNNRIRILKYIINQAPFCNFDTASVNGLLEDQGLITLNNVVSNVSPGSGSDDSSQTVTYQFYTIPPGKISSAMVNAAGNLSFQTAPDSNGTFRLVMRLKDNGGTDGGGTDSSIYQKTVRVNAVNDSPFFTVAGNDTASNGEIRKRPGFLLKLSPGPFDERFQELDTTIICSRPGLFSELPRFSGDTLMFGPVSDSAGTAEIFVRLKDNGGLLNGGVDSSGSVFTITIFDPVSAKGLTIRKSLQFIPNPASDRFRIQNMEQSVPEELALFDLNGKLLEVLQPDRHGIFCLKNRYSGLFLLKSTREKGIAGLIKLQKP